MMDAPPAIVVNVYDGDTLTLDTGTRIRLAGVDADELSGRCHARCAPRSGIEARDNLRRLALGKRIECRKVGTSYGRTVAWCSVGGIDLSCSQHAGGYAVAVIRYGGGRCER